MITSTYKSYRLGDLLEIKHGFAFKSRFFSDRGDYILLTPGNFREEGGLKLRGKKEKYYTGDIPPDFVLRQGDLLVAMTDLTQEAPILGSPVIVPDNFRFLHNQRLGKVINLRRELVDPLYLFYLFCGQAVRAQIKGSASGATVRHTSPSRMYDVKVSLPPRPIQQRIAGTLSNYDVLIENNQRRIRILERIARAIYCEWFENFRFPGHDKVRVIQSSAGAIPEGWERKRTADAFEFCGGATPSTKESRNWEGGTIVWYSPTDLTRAGTVFISEGEKKITPAGLRASSARLFPRYSVMMTSRATLGVLAINTTPACTNQGFITCIPNDRITCPHLYLWLDASKAELEQLGTGATFKEITKRAFKDVFVTLAPPELEKRFHDRVWPVFQMIENLVSRNRNLQTTRDMLLPKLLTGELDFSQLVADRKKITA